MPIDAKAFAGYDILAVSIISYATGRDWNSAEPRAAAISSPFLLIFATPFIASQPLRLLTRFRHFEMPLS